MCVRLMGNVDAGQLDFAPGGLPRTKRQSVSSFVFVRGLLPPPAAAASPRSSRTVAAKRAIIRGSTAAAVAG